MTFADVGCVIDHNLEDVEAGETQEAVPVVIPQVLPTAE